MWCSCVSVQATKVELAATRAVVVEQADTERALLAEAQQTTASLAAAELDVEGLRAKVSRQVNVVYVCVVCVAKKKKAVLWLLTRASFTLVSEKTFLA